MSSLVSICIPTYNGARWLGEAISSALAQTYERVEILIVDDASVDRTLDIVRSFQDSRIRLEVNLRNLGIVGNRNRCVTLARGAFVKFLFQDDILYPTCVEKLARILENHERAGMVFAPRNILLENPDDPVSVAFRDHYEKLYQSYAPLSEVNSGIVLFKRWMATGFLENWIGEPSSVLLRKSSMEKIGLFNVKLSICSDFEMWIRMMYHYDVGFVNEPLSSFRFHSSAGQKMARRNSVWVDRFWLLEGLLEDEDISKNYPRIKLLRYMAAPVALRLMRQRYPQPPPILHMLKSFTEYCVHSLRRRVDHSTSLHGSLVGN
jgi:glycosyltransferase involved in cell wall biosynthesis